jgi:fructose-1,6-bisphosphatase/inositol monophosphatase family enzyme
MRITQADLQTLATILREAAESEILPRFRRLSPGAVRQKTGPQDLVTDADEAAETRITAELRRTFPGALVVGEEAASRAPTLVPLLASAPLAFTIDPIDGTSNFAAGLPLFGVMLAATVHGRTEAAIILDPITRSFSGAIRGEGSYEYAADGTASRLQVAPPARMNEMTGMISWRFMPATQQQLAFACLPGFAQTWDHRCAAHEYRALIAGHAHFVVFNRLMPWDHLPGVLLHQEAGGYAAKFDGTPYSPGETTGGLICATNETSWRDINAALSARA